MSWRAKVRAAEQVQIGKDSPRRDPTKTTKMVSVVFVGAGSRDTVPIQAVGLGAARACADCRHLLKHRTFGAPVAVGPAERFTSIWPPADHAQTCPAFTSKAHAEVAERPYRLSAADAGQCHAQPWGDATCARFVARVSRFLRLGIDATDADDLAERLHLRDVQQDDRIMCVECTHYRPGRCGNHRRAGLNVADIGSDWAAMLQHCDGYSRT